MIISERKCIFNPKEILSNPKNVEQDKEGEKCSNVNITHKQLYGVYNPKNMTGKYHISQITMPCYLYLNPLMAHTLKTMKPQFSLRV
jgi:hypothetical protein